MICHRCLYRSGALRAPSSASRFLRTIATTATPAAPALTAQPFSTPLPPSLKVKPKAKTPIPVSSVPAGVALKGLNYLKGRDDPLALKEEEYPEWLWRCLDVTKKGSDEDVFEGDEFSKSKKQRRAAAKRQRKLEAQMLASGDTDAFAPKIPLQQQTIDLPSNKEGTVHGALNAVVKREEVRQAMRKERRAKIKETNYLKSM